jgi:hypothetical protein
MSAVSMSMPESEAMICQVICQAIEENARKMLSWPQSQSSGRSLVKSRSLCEARELGDLLPPAPARRSRVQYAPTAQSRPIPMSMTSLPSSSLKKLPNNGNCWLHQVYPSGAHKYLSITRAGFASGCDTYLVAQAFHRMQLDRHTFPLRSRSS